MRGLDIRIKFAQINIAIDVIGLDRESDLGDCLSDAEALGRRDYHFEQLDSPALFNDEPELCKAWSNGFDDEAEFYQMECCTGCNESTGHPCCRYS